MSPRSKLPSLGWIARGGNAKTRTVLDQVLVSGCNFVLTLLFFRLLGLEQFGVYSIFFVLVTVVQTIHQASVAVPMMSLLPDRGEPAHAVTLGHLFVFHLIVNLLMTVLCTAILMVTAGENLSLAAILAAFAALSLMQLHEFVRRYLFSSDRSGWALICDGLRYGSLVLTVAFSVFAFDGGSLELALWFTAVASAVSVIATGWIALQTGSIAADSLVADLRRFAGVSTWLGFSGALGVFSSSIFYLVSGGLLTPVAAGVLRASQTVTSALPVMQQGLETYVPVQATKHLRQRGPRALLAFLRVSGSQAMTFVVIVGVPLAYFAESLMHLLFPGELAQANLVGWFVALAILEVFVSYIRFYFRAVLDVVPVFIASATSAVVALVLVYPLVSQFGLTGAALGIVGSRVAMLAVLAGFAILRWRKQQHG